MPLATQHSGGSPAFRRQPCIPAAAPRSGGSPSFQCKLLVPAGDPMCNVSENSPNTGALVDGSLGIFMFAHSNFKRCMVISGVNILAHAALSRMGLLAHRSPRAQQPWQMPTSLCDGLKRRCSHELPAARPFVASPAPHPSIRQFVSHQSGCSPVTKFGRLPARRSASPAVRQSGCPLDRPLASPPARPARVLASLAVLRSDHPPTCPTRRPSVGPAVRRSSHPIARPPGISPTRLPTCPPIRSFKRVRNFD